MMTESVERMLPLYEGKMGHQYDHRFASFFGTGDTDISINLDRAHGSVILPRYWVRNVVASDALGRNRWGTESALLGFRRVARNTDERTCIAALIPFGPASYGWIISNGPGADDLALLLAEYNSFVFDYLLRQFLSQPSVPQGTFEQIPTVTREIIRTSDSWLKGGLDTIARWSAQLAAQGSELQRFADELRVAPVLWGSEHVTRCRAELDAAMFHLYGIERDDVDYIMDTFPIVRRRDEAAHGYYRTKRLILEVYDLMADAMTTGGRYESPFDDVAIHDATAEDDHMEIAAPKRHQCNGVDES